MFKFLKDKLKLAVSKISKKVEEEPVEVEEKVEEIIKEEKIKAEEKTFFKKIAEKIKKKKKVEEIEKEVEKIEKEVPKEEKGIFKKIKEKITTKKISEDKFNELFLDLELALIENNVAVEVVEKIKEDLKKEIVDKAIKRSEIENIIKESLKKSIEDLFKVEKIDLIKEIKRKKEKPYVIVFFGVNGSGKTTTIAKIAHLLLKNNLKCVLAAGDSFRASAIEQIEEWGRRLGVKVIKHSYGSDPAAISFDAIAFSKAHNIDTVLIDTAGRQHSNVNLVEQMKKIVRVAKPDLKIFVGESIVGNDAVDQGQQFNDSIGIDGIILAKADIDEKGGAAISISYVTGKPILYLGNGQKVIDIEEFNSKKIIDGIGL